MPQGQGHQLKVYLYDETAYGEDPGAPSGVQCYIDEFGLSASQGYDEDASPVSRTPDEPLPGVIDVSGSIKPKFGPENIGKLLKHALGVVNTTGAGPYTHTITIGDLPAGMAVDKDMGARLSGTSRFEHFNGVRVSDFSFEFSGESQPSISFSLQGANSVMAAASIDATPDDNGLTKFSLFNATIQEGGADAGIITAGSLNVSTALDTSGYAVNDNGVRSSLDEGKTVVSGEITARFENSTLLNKAINNTETSLKFILSRGTGDGSAGNGHLELECAAVKLHRSSPEMNGPHGIVVKLSFTAYGVNACRAVLKNELASL